MTPTMIYLDSASTTPVDDRVLKSILHYFMDIIRNPSSAHPWGRKPKIPLMTPGLKSLPLCLVKFPKLPLQAAVQSL
jgi:hypothetical protein